MLTQRFPFEKHQPRAGANAGDGASSLEMNSTEA
jgi:hypothetical protein